MESDLDDLSWLERDVYSLSPDAEWDRPARPEIIPAPVEEKVHE